MAEHVIECPQCHTELAPVKVRARTGYLLLLDQCSACGGLWCDKWELFPIASDEVDRLDPVDRKALHKPAIAPETLECPRCNIALRRFHDPQLPPDVIIDRCRLCEGMWVNAGSLRRFDEHRRQGRPPKPIHKQLADTLSEHCRAPEQWSTVENLSSAVDTPRPEAEADDVRGALWQGAAWMALRLLVRLLVRV